ncbi:MAG: Clp protease N-terminal domain-containing protein [Actinomycetota bacterium]|nr:Clp protease N-terminal domain-containing protein [Actinomycetota bacterium]
MSNVSQGRKKVIGFPVQLTPRATGILEQAAQEASRHGANDFIGVEHIFLAILREGQSLPALLLNQLGLTERIVRELENTLGSEGYHQATNWVMRRDGTLIGYMVEAEDGDVIIVDDQGVPVGEDGTPLPSAPGARKPKPVSFDQHGNPLWAFPSARSTS